MTESDRRWLSDRLDQIDHRLDRMAMRKTELEKRVRALEYARAMLVGATAIVTAALGWVASHVTKMLH